MVADMEVTTKLMSCPFCGCDAFAHKGRNAFEDCEIECDGCYASGANYDAYGNDQGAYQENLRDATKAWNRRV